MSKQPAVKPKTKSSGSTRPFSVSKDEALARSLQDNVNDDDEEFARKLQEELQLEQENMDAALACHLTEEEQGQQRVLKDDVTIQQIHEQRDGPLSMTDTYGAGMDGDAQNESGSRVLSASSNNLSESTTSLSNPATTGTATGVVTPQKHGAPHKQNTLQKDSSIQLNSDGSIKLEQLENLQKDDLLSRVRDIVGHLERLEDYDSRDGKRIQMMLWHMYDDYKPLRETIADTLALCGYAPVTMKMLTALHSIGILDNDDVWYATYITYLTMKCFTGSSPKLAQALAENGAVRLLTLKCGLQMTIVVRESLHILYNISCNHGMKQFFYDNKTAETIMPFLKSEDDDLCIPATLLILNIVDPEEYTSRISETGTVHTIVTWIEKACNQLDRTYGDFTPHELTDGLNKLAVNDSNKMMILDEGALPLFLRMLLHDDVREQTSAARVIGTLAFDNEVRIKIVVFPDIVAALKKCTDSTNQSLQIHASGALSVIGRETDVTGESQRFLNMTTQEKRQYYKCGNDFLISQQIPSWQDTGQMTTAGLSKSSDGHFDPDAVINDKVALWRGDITRLEIDVIVKSTSVHEVIRMNGGPLIDYELTMVERQEFGGGIAITSGYFLPAKFVIHTSGPLSSSKDEEEEVLGRCYTNALDAMKGKGLRTMAIPFVSTGTRGKELEGSVSAKVALKTTRRWLEENHSHVDKIVFCIDDHRNWQAYQKIMPEIFPVRPYSGPKLATLPAEIIRMDDQSIQLYKKALSEGETSVHSIRVMVVGHYGVGKTTLTRRILEEDVDLDKRDSTNGIDVHVRRCRVSLADQSWTVLKKDEKVDTTSKEVAKVLIKDLSKQSRNEEPVKSEGLGEGTSPHKYTTKLKTVADTQTKSESTVANGTATGATPNLPPLPSVPNQPRPTPLPRAEKKLVIAVHDYSPSVDNELELVTGDEYEILDNTPGRWWHARDKRGNKGFIPSKYVKKKFDLELYEWYYKGVSREQSEAILRGDGGREGCFMIRDSSKPGMYILSIFTSEGGGQVRHYLIQKNSEDKFYLAPDHSFVSIPDLVYYHKYNAGGIATRLKSPPNKNAPTTALGHNSSGKKKRAKVLFPYKPENDYNDELKLEVGDIVEVIKQEEYGWWEGMLNGKTGVFPYNFVEVIEEVPDSSGKKKRAKVLCSYEPDDNFDDELKLEAGDIVEVIKQDSEYVDWWEGVLNGKTGLFPSHCVGVIVEVEVEFEYTAEQPDELTIKKGEIIKNVLMVPGGWWEGELDGKKGRFPRRCVKDEESLNNKLCTFTITQKGGMHQHWYQCHTCKMVDDEGVCTVCAKVCHKDHDLTYGGFDSYYCDCGAKDDGSCKVLKDDVPIQQIHEQRDSSGKKKRAKVVFSHEPENDDDDELKLEVGDIVEFIKQESEYDGWWEGVLNGKTGLFPSFCVGFTEEVPDSSGKKKRAKVLVPYKPENDDDDELKLEVGDIVEVIKQESEYDGWWEGVLNGKTGLFPSFCVGFTEEVPDSSGKKKRAKVLVPYKPENDDDDELKLEVGDIVEVIKQESEYYGWWDGMLNGKTGRFPSNFVEVTEEVEAVFEYTAEQPDELTIKKGEIIRNVLMGTGGWWEGELDGKRGMFPRDCVKDEESLNNKLCTFTITQKEFMNQHWYHCHTCKLVDNEGMCTVCAKVCHKDHDVTYAKFSLFYCDCGAKDDGSCKVLTDGVPIQQIHEQTDVGKKKIDAVLKDLKDLILNGGTSDDEDHAYLSLWDFAGQQAFYTTHQMFLSSRAIYLLVTDISKHIDDVVGDDVCYFDSKGKESYKISEFVNLWTDSIHCYSPLDKPKVPPIILVGTHADGLDQATKEEQEKKYFKAVRDIFNEKVTAMHVVDDEFSINNTIIDPNLAALKQKIVEVAKEQDYWGERIPVKWLMLERALGQLGDKIITRSELMDVNNLMPVPIASNELLDLFLRFQHDSANILYFNDRGLRDNILLDPQWLIDCLKSLITAEMFRSQTHLIPKQWKELHEDGILRPDLIDAVWKLKENQSFQKHRGHLLSLMEKLNIIAPSDGDDIGPYHLVPCMLKDPPTPVCIKSDCVTMVTTPVLCITTADGFLHAGIFQRLLAACIGKWKISKQGKKNLIYCGYGCFDVDDFHRVMLYFRDCVIQMWVTRDGDENPQPSAEVCAQVRGYVEQELQRISTCLAQLSNLKLSIKCLKCRNLEVYGQFSVDDLLEHHRENDKRLEICREQEESSHAMTCSDLLRHWYGNDLISSIQDNHYHSVFSPDTLEEVPSDKQLNQIASKIGKEYEWLGLELGLPQVEIDRIKIDNPYNVLTQTVHILLSWRQKNASRATFNILEQAMVTVHIDTSEALADVHIDFSVLSTDTLEEVPSDKQLNQIASKIGKEYEQLGLELGLLQVEIDQIKIDNPHHVLTRTVHILLSWRRKNASRATFRILEQAMVTVHIDAAEALAGIK